MTKSIWIIEAIIKRINNKDHRLKSDVCLKIHLPVNKKCLMTKLKNDDQRCFSIMTRIFQNEEDDQLRIAKLN